jgi:MFS family permease
LLSRSRLEQSDMTRRQLGRAVIASVIGSLFEWYDIVVYGILAPLYLGRLFFPNSDPIASVLFGYVGLLFSFGARPIGGALFGHFGDRRGRKAMLITTLLLGGIASFAIGWLPTYADIGVWAPVSLLALRTLVGLSLGGEWGGATLLMLEWSNLTGRRGWWSAWPQISVTGSTLLGFGALAASTALVGPSSWWTWRLPFLLSIVLVGIGLYVRLGVLETPIFTRLLESRRMARHPVRLALRRNLGAIVLTAALRMGEQGPGVIVSSFFLAYGSLVLHLAQPTLILASIIAGAIGLLAPPFFGFLSDVYGRRRIFVIGAFAMLAFAPLYFALLDTRDLPTIVATLALAQVINGMTSGPLSAYIAEQFTARVRYSGASIGAGIGAFFSGGLASAVATLLLRSFHSSAPISAYVMIGCAISLLAASALRDRRGQDLGVEYADDETAPAMGTA